MNKEYYRYSVSLSDCFFRKKIPLDDIYHYERIWNSEHTNPTQEDIDSFRQYMSNIYHIAELDSNQIASKGLSLLSTIVERNDGCLSPQDEMKIKSLKIEILNHILRDTLMELNGNNYPNLCSCLRGNDGRINGFIMNGKQIVFLKYGIDSNKHCYDIVIKMVDAFSYSMSISDKSSNTEIFICNIIINTELITDQISGLLSLSETASKDVYLFTENLRNREGKKYED